MISALFFFLSDYFVRKEMGELKNRNLGLNRRLKYFKEKVKNSEKRDIKTIFKINIISYFVFIVNVIVIIINTILHAILM